MEPVSGLNSGAVYRTETTAGVGEAPKVQQFEDEAGGYSLKPVIDEYIPSEKQGPTGRYWPVKDEGSQLKIYFDNLKQADHHSKKPDELADYDDPSRGGKADGPEKKKSNVKAENCTCSTDRVDREIENLRRKQEELEQQLDSETDDQRIRELEKKLAQIKTELNQKDNDAYRRQHAVFF